VTIPRWLLEKYFGADKRMIAEVEDLVNTVDANGATLASNAEATTALQDATVITLSANATFNNERVLKLADGLEPVDDGEFLTIQLKDVARSENYAVTFIAAGDSQLAVPLVGTVVVFEHAGDHLQDFLNDAAAAAGGVEIGQMYRNGSAVMVRVT
jgi:hypothetical protein